MKWSLTLPILAASSTYALSSSVISSRQAHIQRRGLVDVCAALDLDLALPGVLEDGKSLVIGHLDVCLCVSVLPTFIKINAAASAAVKLLGEAKVIAILKSLIESADSHQTCHYPPHSEPICNTHNPCDFVCTDGYERHPPRNPHTCICKAPHTVCNGKCGNFVQGCGTQAAAGKRRVPRCEGGSELCGISGGSKGKGWECVHTKRDFESCGGCTVASPFGNVNPLGTDCSSIFKASTVACENGKCKVEKCDPGYVPTSTANACIPLVQRETPDTATWENFEDEIADITTTAKSKGSSPKTGVLPRALNTIRPEDLGARIPDMKD